MGKNDQKCRSTAISGQTRNRNMAETGNLNSQPLLYGVYLDATSLSAFSKVRFLTLGHCKDDGTWKISPNFGLRTPDVGIAIARNSILTLLYLQS